MAHPLQLSVVLVRECHIIVDFVVKDVSQGGLVPVRPDVLGHLLVAGENVAELSIGLCVLVPIPTVGLVKAISQGALVPVRPAVLGHLGTWETVAHPRLVLCVLVLIPTLGLVEAISHGARVPVHLAVLIPTVSLAECVPSEGIHDNDVLPEGVIAEGGVAAHNQSVPWVHDLYF